MFIKIQYDDPSSHRTYVNTLEIDNYRTVDDPNTAHILFLDLYGPKVNGLVGNNHERWEIDKRYCRIFVMNDSGKTIDSMDWTGNFDWDIVDTSYGSCNCHHHPTNGCSDCPSDDHVKMRVSDVATFDIESTCDCGNCKG